MESVDALRKWADGLRCIWLDPNDHSIIVATCDDMPPSMDCVNLREHVNEILDGIEHEVEERYTPLPVDADGVPIHVGDVMENIVCPPVHREVTGVGVECFYGWDDGNGRYSQFDVACYRHHHAPTVEDVLREFAQEMNENLGMYTGEAIDADEWRKADERTIAEYAAKLRLAGEDA